MLDATRTMEQAGMTAHHWMIEAKSFVEDYFAEYPPSAKAQLISAYVMAAAGTSLRCMCDAWSRNSAVR